MQITIDYDELVKAYNNWLTDAELHPEEYGNDDDKFTGEDYADFVVKLLGKEHA